MIEQPTPYRRSAWLVSVLMHVCLILSLALLTAMAPTVLPPEEPDRRGEIVLRQLTPRTEVEYLQQAEQTEAMAEASSAVQAAELAEVLPPLQDSTPLAPLPEATPLEVLPSALEMPQLTTQRQTAREIASGNDQAVIDADRERQRRRRAGAPTGPAAELSLFGSAGAAGHRFVFAIDRSKSMGGEGLGVLEAADGQLAAALERLAENHSFQIIAYNDHLARHPKQGLTPATPQAKQQALTFVRGLAAFRGTEHGLALLAASQTEADAIFLLTDGGYPEPASYEMRDILSACSGGTTIHALQFGFGPQQQAAPFMETLAEKTGGSYRYVDVSRW